MIDDDDDDKELNPVANDDAQLEGPLTWSYVRSVDASGGEVSVRRLGVPGGWLYQISQHHPEAIVVMWSPPVFVKAPSVPEIRFATISDTLRFATINDPLDICMRADVVVDLKSGKVVKNRFGKMFAESPRRASKKRKRR